MSGVLNISAYDRVLVIDTQVVLETKPLDQLPWGEFGQGPILLLVCRQAQSEIDAKKNDGRLGTRSRSFNKLLDSFLETRSPAQLFAGPPEVDVALVANARIDWDALDDLDRDDGDDRIVAQALHARVDNRDRLELLSHDMRPRDAAITHGLGAIKLPAHWLREPEPSPDDRERARLERELRVLKTEQPAIEVRVEAITPLPWRKLMVEPASDEQTAAIQGAILRAAPRQDREDVLGFSSMNRDYSFDDRKKKWRERLLAKDLPAMHLGLQRLHAQH
ncbi:MAG TPA: PIN domain-containing protein, partial [Allosphingosinicella sp.]|nr:PIN domain-containing protein [Allosphingosinicella sp.]